MSTLLEQDRINRERLSTSDFNKNFLVSAGAGAGTEGTGHRDRGGGEWQHGKDAGQADAGLQALLGRADRCESDRGRMGRINRQKRPEMEQDHLGRTAGIYDHKIPAGRG